MTPVAGLSERLEQWEDLREQGQFVSPEEICRDRPELLEPLKRQVAALRAMDRLLRVPNSQEAPLDALTVDRRQTPERSDSERDEPRLVAGHEILGELGRGGMGVVYKARHLRLQRIVALKMLRSGAQPSRAELDRFRLEAEAVARLQHPNIVQIHEVGEADQQPFFSLEYVAGGTLAERLASGPLEWRAAAALTEQLARALHAAHEHGILHRDLKPGNVLLTTAGVPKITDFGLARRLEIARGLTETGTVMGTPSYMAPEQATGTGRMGPAVDVYALGATLYELLTQRPPFLGETPLQTLQQVESAEPVPPSRRVAKVPADLDTICLKCLAKDPHRRYESALALAEDLHRLLAGEPIRARPVRAWERAAKWAKRRPAAAALIVAASVGTVSLGLNLRQRALAAETQEQRQAQDKYQQFVTLRDQVHFHGTEWAGVDLARNLEVTRQQGAAALALFGLAVGEPAAAVIDPYLQDRRDEIVAQCQELLLILAEAEIQTAPGQAPERGQFERALEILDVADQLGPQTKAGHERRAEYRERLGDQRGADEERALAKTLPTRALDHYWTGVVRQREGKLTEAVAAFEQALMRAPRHFWSHYYLAVCQLRAMQLEQARLGLNACIALREDSAWLYMLRGIVHGRLQQFDFADRDFAEGLQRSRDVDTTYGILINRADLRREQKQYQAAADDLRQAIDLKPDQYQAYWYLARGYQEQGQLSQAAEQFAWAIGAAEQLRDTIHADDLSRLYRDRARLHRRRGDPAAAGQDLEKAIAVQRPGSQSPVVAAVYADQASILRGQHQQRAALSVLAQAVRSCPDAADLHRQRGLLLLEIHQYDKAVRSLDRCLQNGPATAEVFQARGLAQAALHRYPEAIADYTQALQLQPADSRTRTYRGWAYLAGEAAVLALHDFEKVLRLEPANGDAYLGRAHARVRLGQYARAIADADAALRHGPETPRLLWNAARVFAQAAGANVTAKGEHEERTVRLLQKALERLPEGQRSAFWRTCIHPDAALEPVRRQPAFLRLEAEYTPANQGTGSSK